VSLSSMSSSSCESACSCWCRKQANASPRPVVFG
jgi:hypothetical protein